MIQTAMIQTIFQPKGQALDLQQHYSTGPLGNSLHLGTSHLGEQPFFIKPKATPMYFGSNEVSGNFKYTNAASAFTQAVPRFYGVSLLCQHLPEDIMSACYYNICQKILCQLFIINRIKCNCQKICQNQKKLSEDIMSEISQNSMPS